MKNGNVETKNYLMLVIRSSGLSPIDHGFIVALADAWAWLPASDQHISRQTLMKLFLEKHPGELKDNNTRWNKRQSSQISERCFD